MRVSVSLLWFVLLLCVCGCFASPDQSVSLFLRRDFVSRRGCSSEPLRTFCVICDRSTASWSRCMWSCFVFLVILHIFMIISWLPLCMLGLLVIISHLSLVILQQCSFFFFLFVVVSEIIFTPYHSCFVSLWGHFECGASDDSLGSWGLFSYSLLLTSDGSFFNTVLIEDDDY